jgi:8-oxo-dGTP pyrophosphatase MutT (NUDIX family)
VWRRAGDGREFLILHRRAPGGVEFEGDWAWTPPSGARQPAEEATAAARRELREETGLTLSVATVPRSPSDDVARFVAEAPRDAEIVLDDEHDRFLWLRLDEAVGRCRPAQVGAGMMQAAASLTSAPGDRDASGQSSSSE